MALVTDRLNANKPTTLEPKPGKLTPSQLNNNKDLDVDMRKENRVSLTASLALPSANSRKRRAHRKWRWQVFFIV